MHLIQLYQKEKNTQNYIRKKISEIYYMNNKLLSIGFLDEYIYCTQDSVHKILLSSDRKI